MIKLYTLFEFCSLAPAVQCEISGLTCLLQAHTNHSKANLRTLHFLCYRVYYRKQLIK